VEANRRPVESNNGGVEASNLPAGPRITSVEPNPDLVGFSNGAVESNSHRVGPCSTPVGVCNRHIDSNLREFWSKTVTKRRR
jgi:hypothetical protein